MDFPDEKIDILDLGTPNFPVRKIGKFLIEFFKKYNLADEQLTNDVNQFTIDNDAAFGITPNIVRKVLYFLSHTRPTQFGTPEREIKRDTLLIIRNWLNEKIQVDESGSQWDNWKSFLDFSIASNMLITESFDNTPDEKQTEKFKKWVNFMEPFNREYMENWYFKNVNRLSAIDSDATIFFALMSNGIAAQAFQLSQGNFFLKFPTPLKSILAITDNVTNRLLPSHTTTAVSLFRHMIHDRAHQVFNEPQGVQLSTDSWLVKLDKVTKSGSDASIQFECMLKAIPKRQNDIPENEMMQLIKQQNFQRYEPFGNNPYIFVIDLPKEEKQKFPLLLGSAETETALIPSQAPTDLIVNRIPTGNVAAVAPSQPSIDSIAETKQVETGRLPISSTIVTRPMKGERRRLAEMQTVKQAKEPQYKTLLSKAELDAIAKTRIAPFVIPSDLGTTELDAITKTPLVSSTAETRIIPRSSETRIVPTKKGRSRSLSQIDPSLMDVEFFPVSGIKRSPKTELVEYRQKNKVRQTPPPETPNPYVVDVSSPENAVVLRKPYEPFVQKMLEKMDSTIDVTSDISPADLRKFIDAANNVGTMLNERELILRVLNNLKGETEWFTPIRNSLYKLLDNVPEPLPVPVILPDVSGPFIGELESIKNKLTQTEEELKVEKQRASQIEDEYNEILKMDSIEYKEREGLLEARLNRSREKITFLEEELADLKASSQRQIAIATERRKKWERTVTQLNVQTSKLEQEKEILLNRLKNSTKEIENQTKRSNQLEALLKQQKVSESQKRQIQEQLDKSKQFIEALKKENKRLSDELQEQSKTKEVVSTEKIDEWNRNLGVIQNQLDESIDLSVDQQAKMDRLEAKLAEAVSKIEDTNYLQDEVTPMIAQLQDEMENQKRAIQLVSENTANSIRLYRDSTDKAMANEIDRLLYQINENRVLDAKQNEQLLFQISQITNDQLKATVKVLQDLLLWHHQGISGFVKKEEEEMKKEAFMELEEEEVESKTPPAEKSPTTKADLFNFSLKPKEEEEEEEEYALTRRANKSDLKVMKQINAIFQAPNRGKRKLLFLPGEEKTFFDKNQYLYYFGGGLRIPKTNYSTF